MNKGNRLALALLVSCFIGASTLAAPANPFIGRWALTIPGGGAGWLGITQEDGYLDGSMLWGGGSVVPVEFVCVEGETLYVTRLHKVDRKNADGDVVRTQMLPEIIEAKVFGRSI